MEKLVITGGTPLRGNISVSGSKNAAAALLPAALLSDTPCILENVPYILDNSIMLEIINNLGASGEWIGKNTVRIDSKGLNTYKASYELTSKLRGSYYFLGALLGKVGRAEVSQPGGCNFESRPIDQHIKGLKALGAEIIEEYGLVKAYTENGVTSAHIFMDVVSVGATINLMIAAVKGSGITILENCAKEPHVVDVANFFNTMGANVKGAGTDTIKIKGVAHLESTRPYSVIPDQIEAGTFMIAAAVSRGDVTVRNIIPKHQEALLAKLSEMNVGIEEGEDSIRVYYKGKIRDTKIKTLPYPGFPTDLQPQMTVLCSMADGTSTVSEGVWNSRFQYVDELRRMGADIKVEGKTAIIEGNREFKGAPVQCTDLRAGVALVIAALVAEGTTHIHENKYIDRGYENIEDKLTQLGATITREQYQELDIV